VTDDFGLRDLAASPDVLLKGEGAAMSFVLNPRLAATEPPPVMEARRWITGRTFPSDRPLLNLSQAAPVEPPPEEMRQAMADALLTNPASHLYGPVLGMPELREEVARRWSQDYDGEISAMQVAITSGCNEAFAAVMATLAGSGDEVILPTPWYFNHKMWLDMMGVKAVPLPTGPGLIPSAELAATLVNRRTRAIVLVSPNNPGGAEYPAEVLHAFLNLARACGVALVVDETYRDFDSRDGAPHQLFNDPDWADTLIHLYSFSKAYRLTGHRVGAVVADIRRLDEVEKFLDTVTICPSQIGQIGALWGMQHLRRWVAGERGEILARRRALAKGFPALEHWRLLGLGAYFAYAEHSYDMPSDTLAKRLVEDQSLLLLPGTMFRPANDAAGQREVRIAFANADLDGIAVLFDRLKAFTP
jgi:aspartate/methionine/tyrosine aminotransferase